MENMRQALVDEDVYAARKALVDRKEGQSILFKYSSMWTFYYWGRYSEIEWGDILLDIYAQHLLDRREMREKKMAKELELQMKSYLADIAEIQRRWDIILSRRYILKSKYLDNLKKLHQLAYNYRKTKLPTNKVYLGQDLDYSYYKSPKRFWKRRFAQKVRYGWVHIFRYFTKVGIRGYSFDRFFWMLDCRYKKQYELARERAFWRKYGHIIYRFYLWKKHKGKIFYFFLTDCFLKLKFMRVNSEKMVQNIVKYDLW